MKLETARSIFLSSALVVAALAAISWHEPSFKVLHSQACQAEGLPCQSAHVRQAVVEKQPDTSLLLLMFGLRQSLKAER